VRVEPLRATTVAQWAAFIKKYPAEMSTPQAGHALGLLAALSRNSDFSVGCYCEIEAHCHRSALRDLLVEPMPDRTATQGAPRALKRRRATAI
jgi:uncharacterized protein YeaO (DUF488 family)